MPTRRAGRPLVTLEGRLAVETVRAGTASEAEALVLDAGGGERYVLVKLGGPAFGLPDEARWAGRTVRARGYLIGHELRYDALEAH